jgi:hypothetical protein
VLEKKGGNEREEKKERRERGVCKRQRDRERETERENMRNMIIMVLFVGGETTVNIPALPWEPAVLCGGTADEVEVLCLGDSEGLMHKSPGVHIGTHGPLQRHTEHIVLVGDQQVAIPTT